MPETSPNVLVLQAVPSGIMPSDLFALEIYKKLMWHNLIFHVVMQLTRMKSQNLILIQDTSCSYLLIVVFELLELPGMHLQQQYSELQP